MSASSDEAPTPQASLQSEPPSSPHWMCAKISHFLKRSSPLTHPQPGFLWSLCSTLACRPHLCLSGLLCWPVSSFEDSNWIFPTLSLPLPHGIASDFNLAGSRFCGAWSSCNSWGDFLKENNFLKNAYQLNTRLDMCPGKVKGMKTWAPRQIHFWFRLYGRDSWICCPYNISNPNSESKTNSSFSQN